MSRTNQTHFRNTISVSCTKSIIFLFSDLFQSKILVMHVFFCSILKTEANKIETHPHYYVLSRFNTHYEQHKQVTDKPIHVILRPLGTE
jgi:hypothetical protein